MSASASDSAVPNPLYPTANHPFYPPSLVFPDYRENTLHPIYLLLIFFGALSVWLLFAATVARKLTKGRITGKEMAWVQWYAASSIIHLTFEGTYTSPVLSRSFAPGGWLEGEGGKRRERKGTTPLEGRLISFVDFSFFFTLLSGYFGLFHRSMAHSLHVEAQMWKVS